MRDTVSEVRVQVVRHGLTNEQGLTGAGRVTLEVPGEIRVHDRDVTGREEFTTTLACPECHATTGLTLVARDDLAFLVCPNGRAFRAALLDAGMVRKLFLLHHGPNGPLDLDPLGVGRLGVFAPLPLDEDRSIAENFEDTADEATEQVAWSIGHTVRALAPFDEAMAWSRHLLIRALMHEGWLFETVFSPRNEPALDAHMISVALGLALHEIAWRNRVQAFDRVCLPDVLDLLGRGENPTQSVNERGLLQSLRPAGARTRGGRLRLTDVARLENCTAEEWNRWCTGAFHVVSFHIRQQHKSLSHDVFQTRGTPFHLIDFGRDHKDSGRLDPFWYATEKPNHSS
ncbi:hypothetical protein [Streptomyces finlayi]|uniref:Uncharacterized protein n=1 Tax=Streptomyces finlayi TaxID=67296 RepID=A0A7G7BGL7_9ACTN|nr:hypothetical protein [Streptomyces finlayi]QNE74482.1 hypothetical protein F0344_07540 [Streptomyces finlayi]